MLHKVINIDFANQLEHFLEPLGSRNFELPYSLLQCDGNKNVPRGTKGTGIYAQNLPFTSGSLRLISLISKYDGNKIVLRETNGTGIHAQNLPFTGSILDLCPIVRQQGCTIGCHHYLPFSAASEVCGPRSDKPLLIIGREKCT